VVLIFSATPPSCRSIAGPRLKKREPNETYGHWCAVPSSAAQASARLVGSPAMMVGGTWGGSAPPPLRTPGRGSRTRSCAAPGCSALHLSAPPTRQQPKSTPNPAAGTPLSVRRRPSGTVREPRFVSQV